MRAIKRIYLALIPMDEFKS